MRNIDNRENNNKIKMMEILVSTIECKAANPGPFLCFYICILANLYARMLFIVQLLSFIWTKAGAAGFCNKFTRISKMGKLHCTERTNINFSLIES